MKNPEDLRFKDPDRFSNAGSCQFNLIGQIYDRPLIVSGSSAHAVNAASNFIQGIRNSLAALLMRFGKSCDGGDELSVCGHNVGSVVFYRRLADLNGFYATVIKISEHGETLHLSTGDRVDARSPRVS